jgi:hypothetical protein
MGPNNRTHHLQGADDFRKLQGWKILSEFELWQLQLMRRKKMQIKENIYALKWFYSGSQFMRSENGSILLCIYSYEKACLETCEICRNVS